MFILYKDTHGNIVGLSSLDVQNGDAKDLTKLNAAEIEEHTNPKKTPEQKLADKIKKAKLYLDTTDHKFYVGYVPKEGEDCEAIKAKRDEKREFIRANE